MVKRHIPRGQVNQTNSKTLKALTDLMNDLDKKYSIKVGIIGNQGAENVKGTDLSFADLGAIHEFGATINVTDKMRAYLHSQGIHLKSDTTQIVIPPRSFLRMPLLGSDGKKELQNIMAEFLSLEQEELNKLFVSEHPEILKKVSEALALAGEIRVKQAFETGGYGEWTPISEMTRQRRQQDPDSPPLTDTGDLKDSITSEVKEV